ncbi:MAG: hypothetical protein WC821_02915 [archaeon]|jgi:hypothetical protein
MPTQLTARMRTRKTTALHSKNSNLRKALWESKKQTGNKSLKIVPASSLLAQKVFEHAKVSRRITRLSTVRALDIQKIYDKKTRAIAQKGFQEVSNAINPQEKMMALAKMQKELVGEKLITQKDFAGLMGLVITIEMNNIQKARRL